ncbi:uncharacterized protein LOC127290928 [Leptopilina boulardi]|uniref:uncharacterized protein LOC127290928 n=1 Tax=Leptopilina boulardi TaxID=63433 RepID=UPI0021F669FB|nr:uncharacterized protein LOC127290928 [Leptopilina boulardi]
MDVANLTQTINTIQMISIVTYLEKLNNYLHFNNFLDNTDLGNSIAIINSLVDYLESYESSERELNFFTHYLMTDNKLKKNSEIIQKYDRNFKRILFDHIIMSVIFEKYGNIYGFLAEIFRLNKMNLSIENLINNIDHELMNISEIKKRQVTLSETVINRLFSGTIDLLFPKSLRTNSINSIDFIYAQAGCSLYNSQLVNYNYFFNLNINKQEMQNSQYIFNDCLEIGLAVEQLVIFGNIDKEALKIFALPALLNYVQVEEGNLKNLKIKEIISNPKHLTNAYDLLFLKLQTVLYYSKYLKTMDPKYEYYLTLFHFQNQTSLAKREIMMNCDFQNDNQLEKEIINYINNPNNYSCSDGEKLVALDKLSKKERNNLLYKYHRFLNAVDNENANNQSVKINSKKFQINGEIFGDCNKFDSENGIKKFHCLSLLYSCIVGIIDGNPLNSSSNCPIKELIRFQDIIKWNSQFITFETQLTFSQLGMSLRTLALISSMLAILNVNSNLSSRGMGNLTNVGFPKLPAIDIGYELGIILGDNGLKSIQHLMETIETKFFISYDSESRNFSMSLNHIEVIVADSSISSTVKKELDLDENTLHRIKEMFQKQFQKNNSSPV